MATRPIRVSQLNDYIRRVLQTDPLLGDVLVQGEIANLKFHSSGHVYFSLRDKDSRINCFLAGYNLDRVAFRPEEGAEVVISGSVSVYAAGGYYSLYVKTMDPAGRGDLAVAFEKLKRRLFEEGLFDESRKKPLPRFPKKIAVITAETGAAIQDIRKTITTKNDLTDLLIVPVSVQGPRAAPEIAEAIRIVNEKFPDDVDLIITGRGGGSMEDLWAFNEEIVARAIAASEIPVISAVGHEIDFTISDLVADVRAATPIAAAEMAVPDTRELREDLEALRAGMEDSLERGVAEREERLRHLDLKHFRVGILNSLAFRTAQVDAVRERIDSRWDSRGREMEHKLTQLRGRLDDRDPRAVMKRGYTAVADEEGHLITSAGSLSTGQGIRLTFPDGKAAAAVTDITKESL